MDAKRLIEVLNMVDEDHFAIINNDSAEIYSKRDFCDTPYSRSDQNKPSE